MTKFYSKTTGGFYTTDVHNTMPDDVVEITDEEWQSLLEGQSNGQVIQPDADGKPVLVTPEPVEIVPPTVEERLASVGLSVDDLKTALGI